MESRVIIKLLEPYFDGSETSDITPIDRMTFYNDGFSGAPDSASRRKKLAKALDLPEDISASSLLRAINLLGGRELYERVKKV